MSLHAAVLFKALLVLSSAAPAASLTADASPPTQKQSVSFFPSGQFLRQQVATPQRRDGKAASLSVHNESPVAVKKPLTMANTSVAGGVVDIKAADQPGARLSSSPLKGGLAGMLTGIVQVLCLMWLRTAMNRQYYHGGSLSESISSLWAEGGLSRLYSGVGIALIQVPFAKFGDTFVQTAVTTAIGAPGQHVQGYAMGLIVGSLSACWKLLIVPLDTLKVNLQVHGNNAGKIFSNRVSTGGFLELWSGVVASFMALWIGSFPWWAVYNTVFELWSAPSSPTMIVCRNGLAGMLASVASDACSNSLRVLKVKRQANEAASTEGAGYVKDAKDVMAKDGTQGLFLRALGTRILCGAIQGAFFSVVWNRILASITA